MLVYSNAQLIIDLPAIRSRSLPWMIWRSNANGTGFQGWGSGADSNPSLRWLRATLDEPPCCRDRVVRLHQMRRGPVQPMEKQPLDHGQLRDDIPRRDGAGGVYEPGLPAAAGGGQ